MRWYPKLEIYNGGWETLPRDSFFDRVEVDKSTGEATVARFTIKREYTPDNPLDWMARLRPTCMASSANRWISTHGHALFACGSSDRMESLSTQPAASTPPPAPTPV